MSRLIITIKSINLRELWKCNLRITHFIEANTHSLCLSSLLTCLYIFLFQLFLSLLLGFPYSLFCGLASLHRRRFRKFGWLRNHFICLFYRESSICLCVRDSHLHLQPTLTSLSPVIHQVLYCMSGGIQPRRSNVKMDVVDKYQYFYA